MLLSPSILKPNIIETLFTKFPSQFIERVYNGKKCDTLELVLVPMQSK